MHKLIAQWRQALRVWSLQIFFQNGSKSQNTQTNTPHSGVRRLNFLHPKSLKMAVFGCKKMGLRTPEFKTWHDFFVVNSPQKWWMRHLFHMNITFGQILKIAYFRLNFGRFSLIKPQNQNPMVQSVNFWDKNLIFGLWFPYIQRQLDLSGWVTKMNFAFWGTP